MAVAQTLKKSVEAAFGCRIDNIATASSRSGDAAETDNLEQHALGKMERKRLDAIVANDVANPRIGFESDSNEVTIYLRDGRKTFVPHAAKAEIAAKIFEAIAGL